MKRPALSSFVPTPFERIAVNLHRHLLTAAYNSNLWGNGQKLACKFSNPKCHLAPLQSISLDTIFCKLHPPSSQSWLLHPRSTKEFWTWRLPRVVKRLTLPHS